MAKLIVLISLATALVLAAAVWTADSTRNNYVGPAGWLQFDSIQGEEEFVDYDSAEIIKRSLEQTKTEATITFISYLALMKGSVPCDVAGASYYNCTQGAEANPYDRGCSAITRCRS